MDRRIPSLDGLRAISILMVLYGHAVGTAGFPVHHTSLGLAEFGVRVFFIISGFLITKLLLNELESTGRISLKGFYRRRVLRIFPHSTHIGRSCCCSLWAGCWPSRPGTWCMRLPTRSTTWSTDPGILGIFGRSRLKNNSTRCGH